MRNLFALLFLLTMFLHLPVTAQSIGWKEIDGVSGISLLTEGANGKLFASALGKLLISSDNGVLWDRTPTVAGSIAQMASRGNTLVESRLVPVQFFHQVFLSTDNGENFTRILAEPSLSFGSLAISDSGFLFATVAIAPPQIARVGVARYNGARWDTLGALPFGVPGGVFATAGPAVIDHANVFYFGTTDHGIFVSSDYGKSWINGLPARNITSISVVPPSTVLVGARPANGTDGGVFLSSDAGRSWTSLGLSGKTINSVAVDNAGAILATATSEMFRYSQNTGEWIDVSPRSGSYDQLLVTSSGTIFAASSADGIYHSIDNGMTWLPSGPRNLDIFATAKDAGGTLYAGTLGHRILRSTNDGVSWQQSLPGTISDNVFAFANGGSTLLAATDKGLYSTTDNGDSWMNISEPGVTGAVYSVVVSSVGTLFIGTDFGVYVSSDNGSSWNVSGLGTSTVFFLAKNESDILYAATAHDGIFSSLDQGATWLGRGLVRNDIQTIGINRNNDLFVGVYGGIFRSTDDGIHWAQTSFTSGYVYTFAFQGPDRVFAGAYNGVFSSDNKGDTWRQVGLQNQFVLSLTFDDRQNLFAGSLHGGMFESIQPLTSVETSEELPKVAKLFQNYPNPFNPSTVIRYDLSVRSHVTLKMYDVLGREVATLVDGMQDAGYKSVEWNASENSSGIYFYKLTAGGFTGIRKMLLLR